MCIRDRTDILIYDGDSLLFDGFADRQQAIENSQGAFTPLWSRSRGALHLDNEARPQTYQRTTAEDIFRRHLAPHGFTEIRGHRQALSSFVVGKGMSEWEVLTSFLAVSYTHLGLQWSPTERMSAQQADILTSELDSYRMLLNGGIRRIAGIWLLSRGIREEPEITWEEINLQDQVEAARARLYDAQAKNLTGQAR